MSICTLTEAAQDQINDLCKQNDCFAISLNVKGGGCAGFEYDWGLVKLKNDIDAGDEIISAGSGNLVIGVHSLIYLFGTEIDYVKNLFGANFDIRNPNTKSSCGCGVSVNFNDNIHPHFMD